MAGTDTNTGTEKEPSGHGDDAKTWWANWRRWTLLGVPLMLAGAFFVFGIVFWGGFNTAMEATNTLKFCISCHEMKDTVYQEYKETIHFQNRTGVRATCSDCHVPDPWVHKVVRKIKASRELYYKVLGSIDTPEKFDAKRLTLAKRVWSTMKETDSRECRNCHNLNSMNPEFQRPRARKQHLNAFKTGQTCIDCHKGIAHKNIRDRLAEDELEALEKPDLAFAREVPASFMEGLARVEAKEAEEVLKKKAEQDAAEKAIAARIEKAVAAAAKSQEGKSAKAGEASANQADGAKQAAAGAASPIDWEGIEAKTVTLFYPGQASYEWVQTGKDHGGARAFTKGGDRCAGCHLNEVKDMGAKIVSGEKAEATPIPGKRGHIDVKVQAAHDEQNLYLRFQWANGEHTPVPFVEGGKMDPKHESKIALMIAGEGIERVEQAGCWVTCHHDSRYMPDAPPADAIAASEASKHINAADGITKYLGESRSEMEVRGRRGAKRGGWDKLKPDDELKGLLDGGTYMDLLRYVSGGEAGENGHVFGERVMTGGETLGTQGSLENGTWTVTMSRPLKSSKPGDVSLEPGKLYTVGIAIHDDFTSARFHHVSLEYRLGLDMADAEINAVKQ